MPINELLFFTNTLLDTYETAFSINISIFYLKFMCRNNIYIQTGYKQHKPTNGMDALDFGVSFLLVANGENGK